MSKLKRGLMLGAIALSILAGSYASAQILDDRIFAAYPESKQEELITDLGDDRVD